MFELLLAGQLFRRRVLCREEQLLLTFFGEGSRQLKLNRASLVKWGAESAGRLFSVWCSSACRSTCKLRDLKSPAPIPDPRLVLRLSGLKQNTLRDSFSYFRR